MLKEAHLIEEKYWLGGGTVLGLYRQNDFIPGDTDIDIEVEGFDGVEGYLLGLYGHMELIRTVHFKKKPMQIAFMHKETIFDIYVLWKEGESMVNHNDMGTMQTPYKFYKELANLQTKYGDYPIPWPIEDYLVVRYGKDWATPAGHKGLYTHAI